jgi:hypothetical protein
MSNKSDIDQFVKYFENNFIITERGKIQMKTKRTFLTPQEVYVKYVAAMSVVGIEPLQQPEVEAIIKNLVAEKSEPEAQKIPIKDYIYNMIRNSDQYLIDDTFTEIKFKLPGETCYSNASFDDLCDHFKAIKEDDPVLSSYTVGTIEANLKQIALGAKNASQNKIAREIKYDPKYVKFVDMYLKVIYDFFKISQDFEIFKTMMCHWAWQVKRKLTNKKVVWHIWINFNGVTKIGKSWMVRGMSKPFKAFYLEAPIRIIFDDTKEVMKMTNNYIINFEELAVNKEKFVGGEGTLSKDEISTLKSMLTGEKMDTRIYGKQTQMKRDITFSCISTANEHLYDVIFDETSMRRYFEFDCQRTVPGNEEERAELNKYLDHSLEFWKGIDENLDKGYWDEHSELGRKVFEIQSQYYPTKSTLLYWNKFYKFIPDPMSMPTNVFERYREFCKNSGFNSKNLINFNAEIAKRWPNLVGSDGLPHFRVEGREGATDEPEDFSQLLKDNNKIITVGDGLPAPDVDDFT